MVLTLADQSSVITQSPPTTHLVSASGSQATHAELALKADASALALKAPVRNRHLNPAFQICQDRAAGATVVMSASGYVFDGVVVAVSGGGALACSRAAKATPGGSPYRARASVSTGDVSIAAGDYYNFSLLIEGTDVTDLMFGTASARSFVWRGVVNLPAGTYGISFANAASTRSYVTTFTVSAGEAGTDKLITVTVPGDTTGTWINDASGIGISVRIALAIGATYQTATTDAWQAGNYLTTSAQTNAMASTGAVFELADIGLYAGTGLPSWELPSFGDDLRRCHRYWESSYPYGVAPGTPDAGEPTWGTISSSSPEMIVVGGGGAFRAEKRVWPAFAVYHPSSGAVSTVVVDGNPIAVTAAYGSPKGFTRMYLASGHNGGWNAFYWVANSRL